MTILTTEANAWVAAKDGILGESRLAGRKAYPAPSALGRLPIPKKGGENVFCCAYGTRASCITLSQP